MTANGCAHIEENGVGDVEDLQAIPSSRKTAQKNESSKSSPKIKSKSDREIIRLIGQHLKMLGLSGTVEKLVEESGCTLEHPAATKFRNFVLRGQWDKADHCLRELKSLVEPQAITKIRFCLMEQKYLEYLQDGDLHRALRCLQHEISTLNYDEPRVHQLSSLICASELYADTSEIRQRRPLSRQQLLEKLQGYLPAAVMLPPKRLQSLLTQALRSQKLECRFHNDDLADLSLDSYSLLSDHQCAREGFPCYPRQVLNNHCDEVWFCRFSPDGTKLATGAKDGNLILFDVEPETRLVCYNKMLECQQYGINYLAWSPDSRYLITCGPEDSADLLVWDIDLGEQKCRISNSPEDSLTCAAWHMDSRRFITGGLRGQFFQCDYDGNVLDSWEGIRVHCLGCLNDNRTAIAADTHNRVRSYDFRDMSDQTLLREDYSIMSFTLNRTGSMALLNVATQGVHLWDLANKILIRKYAGGITQGHFTIHSCFGGANQNFIASGSEDMNVYLWNANYESPIATLAGHTKTVNCVHWNPVYHDMIASVSDDHTVRIWGTKDAIADRQLVDLELNSTV